jgi:hypothetical protein
MKALLLAAHAPGQHWRLMKALISSGAAKITVARSRIVDPNPPGVLRDARVDLATATDAVHADRSGDACWSTMPAAIHAIAELR